MARSVLATFVFGLVAVVVTFFLAIALCFSKHCHVAHAASVTSLLGGIFVLISIVMFHGTEYMETNKDGNPGEIVFQNTWSTTLQKASHTEYGYSYAVAWVGLILAAFDGILFLLTARAIRMYGNDEDDSSDSGSSDRQQVVRKSKSPETYDNYAVQKGSYPMPMTYGYPSHMQSMPAYPALTYGNSVYSMPEGHRFRTDA